MIMDVENSNIGKENIEYLTDNRRQISRSKYSNENWCENLKEEKMDSRLMTRIKNTESKIFAKLKNICLLQMGLQDPIKKLNEQEIIILKDTNGIKHSKRIEDCSEKPDSKDLGSLQHRGDEAFPLTVAGANSNLKHSMM